ncbi:hypothetical protein QTA58_05135 [Neorhizobium sp. CSC1952]|uniref:hypothetical protein n=1 Tax=Neorhizobium sp. CSC1952 TaxID=2978974 RepID=UPI0025A66C0B|nr:hypothetical protein [Rhizobium sp. CSC1952]WJR68145.1 hypothetical protein QTA58_05135 [Rhizobium sp. CSC1952]
MEEQQVEQRPSRSEAAAADYARTTAPIDTEMGWRREDLELAFLAGVEWRALQNE